MTNQQMAPPPVVTHPLAVAKQPKAANATTTSLPATAPIQVYSLTEVAHATLQHYFFQQQNEKSTSHKEPKAATNWQTFPQRFVAPDLLKQTGGVFVTFSHNGQSRACWGTVFPEHADLITATVEATLGALTQEYRYPPIRASEVETLQVQVTVVRAVEAIRNIREQNPFRDGLMVRAGGKSGVILPGEATDAHTQLIQACLKAGIGPSDTYQLYRIIADVYR
ncbi:MAG: AMMECR1 domain-containing protein [Candidatus Melainabacteria bacterium]|nr:AMMECR1 domain-containing protein [Candidatus Melainabacteria bacterium]